jgi:hypothetical protein
LSVLPAPQLTHTSERAVVTPRVACPPLYRQPP